MSISTNFIIGFGLPHSIVGYFSHTGHTDLNSFNFESFLLVRLYSGRSPPIHHAVVKNMGLSMIRIPWR
jgi:hypothetical protein